MTDWQCQHCGQPVADGHNCDGTPFESGPAQNSVPATGTRKEILQRKGFSETFNVDGVFYRHPMHGIIAIYPGGAFRTAYVKTALALDAYLDSLPDSSYTDIGHDPYQASCDSCGGVGPIFPDEHYPFRHEDSCPHRVK
jgi:hypothetical protein